MPHLRAVSVKVENFKCFGPNGQGFDSILPMNLVIGRNNSGKSTLLDLIGLATNPADAGHLSHKGGSVALTFAAPISREAITASIPNNVSGGAFPGSHLEYGLRSEGKPLCWRTDATGAMRELVDIDPPLAQYASDYPQQILRNTPNPFAAYRFIRLLADRNVRPETEQGFTPIHPDGAGFTNAVNQFVNHAALPSDLVEQTMLWALNEIFEPDARFDRLLVQKLGDGSWELFLEEAGKGRIALSQSGSGLKTILLVLGLVYLMPSIEQRNLGEYLFGLEELENNLHPALQRRLFLWLRQRALDSGCHFFVTTHSNVVIDLFAHDAEAQILHVTHSGVEAAVRRVTTHVDNCGILDDLDVRASDLLQANGIVWLEGPSDRLYFNRWIELVTGGEIKEGAHYQCVYYGGRLLAHLSAEAPGVEADEVVRILRVNRNAIMMIDSDKRSSHAQLNSTKQRIISEIEAIGGIAWVTAGREVENYLPVQALRHLYSSPTLEPVGRYQEFAEYLDAARQGEGKIFLRNKVLYADRVVPHLDGRGIDAMLDLKDRLDSCVERIRRWNSARAV